MATKTGSLRLERLTKEFGNGKEKVVAVRELSLTINPGEFVTLLGPSGCGKTTALRMIAGFETPTGGQVLLDGDDLSAMTPDKRPMGMVFQSYALFPHMTVFDNVAYGLRVKKMSANEIKSAVAEVLESMSLSHLANRAPNQLSGGQQQRVALARAMVVRPKVLLFDEPLSNLDAKLRAQMRVEIRSIQRRLGITSIFVTHDQDEALSISDRIAVMKEGKIEQFSTPEDIYNKPATEYVANFIGSLNRYEGSYSQGQIASGKDVVGVRPEDVTFDSKSSAGAVEATVSLVVPRGHFHEVYLKRSDVEIRAFISSDVPAVGAKGYAKIHKALIYRNGKLASVE